MAGGAVTVSFSAACHPNTEQAGELCQLVQQDRYLTLIPPSAEAQQSPQMALGGVGDTLDQQEAEEEARRLAAMGAAQDDQAKAA